MLGALLLTSLTRNRDHDKRGLEFAGPVANNPRDPHWLCLTSSQEPVQAMG